MMNADSTGSESHAINGWYELFSRGSRDWLRHSEKVREAVREHLPQIVAGSTSSTPAPRRYACRCGCSSTTASACVAPARRRASARARSSPARCWASRTPRRARAEGRRRHRARRHRADARVQGRRHHRLALGGAAAARICKPRRRQRRKPIGSARAGTGAVPAHGSIAAARSRKRPSGAPSSPIRRHSSMRICASGSSRAAVSRRCVRWCFSCWMSRAA